MKTKLVSSGLVIAAALLGGVVTEKPRIFVTESQSLQFSGEAALGMRRAVSRWPAAAALKMSR
jgi:hypothetical protein